MRTHKVGTFTLGCTLILFGVLFLVHLFGGMLTYSFIFRLWPVVFRLAARSSAPCRVAIVLDAACPSSGPSLCLLRYVHGRGGHPLQASTTTMDPVLIYNFDHQLTPRRGVS